METVTENQVHCLYCDKPIYNRRKGAIYCSIKCGYTFRNTQNSILNKTQHERIKYIRHNDQILQKFINQGKDEVTHDTLQHLKFYFEYCTKSILGNKEIEGAEFFRFKIQKMNNNTYKISKI